MFIFRKHTRGNTIIPHPFAHSLTLDISNWWQSCVRIGFPLELTSWPGRPREIDPERSHRKKKGFVKYLSSCSSMEGVRFAFDHRRGIVWLKLRHTLDQNGTREGFVRTSIDVPVLIETNDDKCGWKIRFKMCLNPFPAKHEISTTFNEKSKYSENQNPTKWK